MGSPATSSVCTSMSISLLSLGRGRDRDPLVGFRVEPGHDLVPVRDDARAPPTHPLADDVAGRDDVLDRSRVPDAVADPLDARPDLDVHRSSFEQASVDLGERGRQLGRDAPNAPGADELVDVASHGNTNESGTGP